MSINGAFKRYVYQPMEPVSNHILEQHPATPADMTSKNSPPPHTWVIFNRYNPILKKKGVVRGEMGFVYTLYTYIYIYRVG